MSARSEQPSRWVLSLVLAVFLGIGAGTGAVLWLHYSREAAIRAGEDPVALLESDRVDDTVAALAEDGVVVSDDGRYLLDEAGERAVEEAVAASPERVFVVVWASDQELGASEYEVVDVLGRRLVDDLDLDRAVLYVWQGPEQGFVEELGDNGSVPGFSSASDFVGDPATTLPQAVAAVADTDWYDSSGDSDYWGGVGGGTVLGVLIAGLVVLGMRGLVFFARVFGGDPIPGRWRPGNPTTAGKKR